MEKRALVAMMLILALLLIYQTVFIHEKPPAEAPPVARAPSETVSGPAGAGAGETGGVVPSGAGAVGAGAGQPAGPAGTAGLAGAGAVGGQATPASAGSAESLAGGGFAGLPEGAGEDVVVRAPLYRAVFSTRGGGIKSFQLKRYPGLEGRPVELVPLGGPMPFTIVLLTKTGERIDLAGTLFQASSDSVVVAAGSESSLEFTATAAGGLSVTRICTFQGDDYPISAGVEIAGAGSDGIRAVEMGWQSGLAVTEPNGPDDLRNFASLTLTDQALVKNDLGKVRKGQAVSVGGAVAWSGLRTKYFFVGFVPPSGVGAVARAFPGAPDAIGMTIEAELSASTPLNYLVYAGPLDYQGLKRLGHGLDKAVDFGWKWISPLSRVIFAFLVLCYKAIPNYGWVIIVLSALTKLLFHPLTQKSMKSMRMMQKVQPEIEQLREKHKKDPQALNKAIMELYRKRGVNPMGGCLPLILQMPVFIALFNVLQKTIELRQAPFIFWMRDLSTPDAIAHLPFSVPFIGTAVSLLPILMGIAMFVQQKMTTTDPKQAMMTYVLPIVFTVMFYKFPSGLVLYWLVNNVLTIAHQYYMNRADRLADAKLQESQEAQPARQ